MHNTCGFSSALRIVVKAPLLLGQQAGSFSFFCSLHTLAISPKPSRPSNHILSAARTQSSVPVMTDDMSPRSAFRGQTVSAEVQQAGSTAAPAKAKRKVALHVAYCGSGFQGS